MLGRVVASCEYWLAITGKLFTSSVQTRKINVGAISLTFRRRRIILNNVDEVVKSRVPARLLNASLGLVLEPFRRV